MVDSVRSLEEGDARPSAAERSLREEDSGRGSSDVGKVKVKMEISELVDSRIR
jgi:hypothetical protein